jgi:hypothetical protein
MLLCSRILIRPCKLHNFFHFLRKLISAKIFLVEVAGKASVMIAMTAGSNTSILWLKCKLNFKDLHL